MRYVAPTTTREAASLMAEGGANAFVLAGGTDLLVRMKSGFIEPDLVVDIHRQHVAAGAEVLETNSFGANRFRLAAHGLESRVEELNVAAAELAAGETAAAREALDAGLAADPAGRAAAERHPDLVALLD